MTADQTPAPLNRYAVIPGDTSQPAPSYYVAVGSQVVADAVRAALTAPEEPSQ